MQQSLPSYELFERFNGSKVFSITLESEPIKTRHWVRASEVCKVLEFSNTKEAIATHCKDWQSREIKLGAGRPAIYICFSGLMRLCLKSKSPVAIEFQDWLTEELLPKLFASGSYSLAEPSENEFNILDVTQDEKYLSYDLGTVTFETLDELIEVIFRLRRQRRRYEATDQFLRCHLREFLSAQKIDRYFTDSGIFVENKPKMSFFIKDGRSAQALGQYGHWVLCESHCKDVWTRKKMIDDRKEYLASLTKSATESIETDVGDIPEDEMFRQIAEDDLPFYATSSPEYWITAKHLEMNNFIERSHLIPSHRTYY